MDPPAEISEECEKWRASVKYKNYQNEKEYVQVGNIDMEDKTDGRIRCPYRPKTLTDYIYGFTYCIKFSRHSADGKDHMYYGAIGRLAVTKEQLKATSGRTKWRVMHESEIEPPRSCPEDEVSGSALLHKSRALNQQKSMSKKICRDSRFKAYMSENLQGPHGCKSSSKDISSKYNHKTNQDQQNYRDGQSYQEEQSKNINSEMLLRFFEDRFNALEAKIEKRLQEVSDISRKFNSLEENVNQSLQKAGERNKEILGTIREELSEVKDLFCKLPSNSKITDKQSWLNSSPEM